MATYTVSTGAIAGEYEAEDCEGALNAFVADAGYASISDAADACHKTESKFREDIRVFRNVAIER